MKKTLLILLLVGASYATMSYAMNEEKRKLLPCPASPNCVSTLTEDEAHTISPIAYSGSMEQTKQRLLDVLNSLPRINILANDMNYLQVTQTSLIFRFVDDVEFVFDDEQKLVHFRSASRTGYSDFGVNRKRMEKIRALMRQ